MVAYAKEVVPVFVQEDGMDLDVKNVSTRINSDFVIQPRMCLFKAALSLTYNFSDYDYSLKMFSNLQE